MSVGVGETRTGPDRFAGAPKAGLRVAERDGKHVGSLLAHTDKGTEHGSGRAQ